MRDQRYRIQPYDRELSSRVLGHTDEGGILLADTIFYPAGGGQPGDAGVLAWDGQEIAIATAIKADEGAAAPIVLVPAEPASLPPVGVQVAQRLDWERRHRHMRVHTALHLLSVVIPLPVTGGAVAAEKGRLDFDMTEPPADKAALEDKLNALISADLPVREEWISDAELDENPGLVKTMSVQPPRGSGWIRLIRIGAGEQTVDLQPCGGTHVASTAEIGPVRIGKIEKKGRQNRRVSLHLLG